MQSRPARILILLILASAVRETPAVVTNEVDVAALAACVSGVTNGWTVSELETHRDDKLQNVRFGKLAAEALSPTFAKPIHEIIVSVKSSSASGRKLSFQPCIGLSCDASRCVRCDYSPTASGYVDQSLSFAEGEDVTRFRIALDTGGGQTTWALARLAVVTGNPCLTAPPDGLTVRRVGATSVRLAWTDNAQTVSNEVSVLRIDRFAQQDGESAFGCDFGALSAAGSPKDYSEEIGLLYPGLSGTRLYSPANTNGILQISIGTEQGVLYHRGLADYTGATLLMTVKRHPTDEHRQFSVEAVTSDSTSRIADLPLSTAFRRLTVDLSGIPGGAAIAIRPSSDAVKSNRRIFLDDLEIRRGWRAASVTTNRVASVFAAPCGHCRIGGLRPGSEYVVEIVAFDENGIASNPSARLGFGTAARDPSLQVTFR